MKIQIYRNGENIVTNKDFSDIKDFGELTQFLCELEIIKKELLELYEGMLNEWMVELLDDNLFSSCSMD